MEPHGHFLPSVTYVTGSYILNALQFCLFFACYLFNIFQTPAGNVEAKVMCFFRRRDLPNTLITLADKHQRK